MSDSDHDIKLKYLESLLADEAANQPSEPLDEETQAALQLIKRVAKTFKPEQHDQAPFQPGDSWGNLTIEAQIGSGGVGSVFQAYDHVLNRKVAVKFLQKHIKQIISSTDFINEARRLAKVRHPNVMAIFGAHTEQGVTGFWAELLTGTPLTEVNFDHLTSTTKLKLLHQLSAAVTAIHEQQIIHADIKPQNIMLEADRGPVLMDFGAGLDVSNKDKTSINSLTPMAMAPELFDGGTATESSDVYALGIVFYFILSNGQHPHQSDTFEQLKQRVKNPSNQPIGSALKVPRAWRQLINQMCAYEASSRPNSQAVLNRLQQLIEVPQKRLKRLALGSLLTFLLGSLLVLGFSYITVNEERNVAQKALQETREINDLITDFILSVSPSRQGKDVLLIDVLNQFKTDLQESDDISLEIQSQLLGNLATTQFFIGHYDQGIELMTNLMQQGHSPKLQTELLLAYTKMIDSHPDMDAQSLNEQVEKGITQAKDLIDKHQLKTGKNQAELAYLLGRSAERKVDPDAAKTHYQNALNYWQSVPSSKYSEQSQFNLLTTLGNVASEQGDMSNAESYYKQALSKAQQHTAIKYNSNLMVAFTNLATYLAQTGNIDQAIEAFTELLDKTSQFFGQDHPKTLYNAINLISSHNQAEQFQTAQELIDQYSPHFASLQHRDSPLALHFLSASAIAQAGLGQYEMAEKTYQMVITRSSQSWGAVHGMTLTNQVNLAEVYNLQGQHQLAITYLKEPIELAQSNFGPNHEITLYMYQTLAQAHQALEQHDLAASLMKQVYDAKLNALGADHPSTQQAKQYWQDSKKQIP